MVLRNNGSNPTRGRYKEKIKPIEDNQSNFLLGLMCVKQATLHVQEKVERKSNSIEIFNNLKKFQIKHKNIRYLFPNPKKPIPKNLDQENKQQKEEYIKKPKIDLHAIFGARFRKPNTTKKPFKKGTIFRKFTAIMKVAPTNQEQEKAKFFESNF